MADTNDCNIGIFERNNIPVFSDLIQARMGPWLTNAQISGYKSD